MAKINRSITMKLIILNSVLIMLTGVLVYLAAGTIYANLLSVLAIIAHVLIAIIVTHRLMAKEKEKMDRVELALKSAARGNYHTRIEFNEEQALTIYEQFNELMEEIEQKVKYLQVLGEERIVQEASTVEIAVHEERKRLARDLHDTVSQQLFAIQMSSASLQKLHGQNEEAMLKVIDQLVKMSSVAQTQMRKLIAHLRPMELVNQSLSDALVKWFPDYCRQNQIQGSLDNRLHSALNEAKEHQLFMIIQETMANIVKHAKCEHCYLSLYDTDSQIQLELRDDGIGFDVNIPNRKSYGLITMQERAKKLGGNIEIISRSGKGTVVKVAIPKLDSGGVINERVYVS